jgi:hypothetical protein
MNLPKWLVQKLGKERVSELVMSGEPLPPCDIRKVNTHPDYHNRAYASHVGKKKARKKWEQIHFGKLEPDPLYDVDEAIERAGL